MGRRIVFGMTSWRRTAFMLIAAIAALAVASCENALTDLIKEEEAYKKNLLDFDVYPSGSATGREHIRVEFAENVDSGSLVISGTLGITAGDVDPGDWESGSVLILDPDRISGGLWPEGSQNAVISATSATGKEVTGRVVTFSIQYIVCVDDSNGTGTEYGSILSPYDTIQEGLDEASNRYVIGAGESSADVRVADGTYAVACGPATYVANLRAGVSILGGYNSSFSTRTAMPSGSIITDTSNTGGNNFAQPQAAVYCDSSITETTTISGFTITLPEFLADGTDSSAGVYCNGGDPVLSELTISGPISESDSALGVVLNQSTATLSNSVISDIQAATEACGVAIFWSGGSAIGPQISSNTISGMNAPTAGCIHARHADSQISSNTLTTETGSTFRYAIYLRDTNYHNGPTISNNTINMDSITNLNFYGLYEYDADSDPYSFTSNHFISDDGDFYCDESVTMVQASNWSSQAVSTGSATGTLPSMSNTHD